LPNPGKWPPSFAHPGPRRAVAAVVWQGRFHIHAGFGIGSNIGTDAVRNDLWVWDANWRRIAETGPPAARYPSLVVIDRENLVRFGGCIASPEGVAFSNAVWRYKETWRQEKTKGQAPSPRYTSAVAGFSGDLYVFGGCGQSVDKNTKFSYFGDLWRLRDHHWELIHDHASGPGPRYGFGWVADQGRLHIFGGFDGTQDLADYWVLDLASLKWSQLEGGPPGRYCPAMGVVRSSPVLFGGRSKTNSKLNFDDTWVFDGKWRALDIEGPGYHAKSGYASDATCLWIFGGEGPRGHLSDLWQFDGETWACVAPGSGDDPVLW